MRVTMKADFTKAMGNVRAWSQRKQQRIKDTVNESAINIQTGAKANLSRGGQVNTGRLRSSIAIEPANGPGFKLRVGTKVFYAPYVEWGTGIFSEHPTEPGRKTPWAFPIPKAGKKEYGFKRITKDGVEMYVTRGSKPHPFLFPAFESERPKFIAAMRGVMKE
jgi:HK97 gp10 family phage protein